jgi:hypothetical protein
MNIRVKAAMVAAIGASLTVTAADPVAYVVNGPKWNVLQVPYYVNTANLRLPGSAVESSVQAGASTWHQQGGVDFTFSFAGQSSQSVTTNDGINLVVFRNASNGTAIATTYWWSSGSRILDADIVFWDGGFTFFSGSSGCANGFYIEDIAAHEFGHALGLGHSDSVNATMYFATAACDTRNRTLDTDDIAGVRALYPPAVQSIPDPPTNLRVVS